MSARVVNVSLTLSMTPSVQVVATPRRAAALTCPANRHRQKTRRARKNAPSDWRNLDLAKRLTDIVAIATYNTWPPRRRPRLRPPCLLTVAALFVNATVVSAFLAAVVAPTRRLLPTRRPPRPRPPCILTVAALFVNATVVAAALAALLLLTRHHGILPRPMLVASALAAPSSWCLLMMLLLPWPWPPCHLALVTRPLRRPPPPI